MITDRTDPTFKILLHAEQIQERVLELAQEIDRDYGEDLDTPLILLIALKGGVNFSVHLSEAMEHPNIRVDYIKISSYGSGTESSGNPIISVEPTINMEGSNVIVIDDIVDTGYSLRELIDYVQARNPKTLATCVLLSKPSRRVTDVLLNYVGFEIEDKWVVGYGLDEDEKGRTTRDIQYKVD